MALSSGMARAFFRVSKVRFQMKISPIAASALAFSLAAGLLAPCAAVADDALNGVVAVASKVSDDYVRTKLPNGSFETEYYSFGPGGQWGGEIKDSTIDNLHFMDVAHVVAGPLADRNYLPAKDPKNTKLLIMVYWGTTAVPGPTSDSIAYDQLSAAQATAAAPNASAAETNASMSQMSSALTMIQMTNDIRDQLDFKNAKMLGY